MKPRENIDHTTTREGIPLELIRHDDRLFLESNGRQLDAAHLSLPANELARLATEPFRPARQPQLLILGLGLGHLLRACLKSLPQEKATFHLALEAETLPAWLKSHCPPSPLQDPRVQLTGTSPYDNIPQQHAPYQAILGDLDYLEALAPEKWQATRLRWLRFASDSLKAGGLLAFLLNRQNKDLEKNLRLANCDPVFEIFSVTEKSKKNRVLYLARKGHYQRSH